MGEVPRSLREFEARFPDDRACARWLLARRWPDGFRCPACGHAHGWELGRGVLLIECARCHRQTSVTAGTVMHRSHLPLKTWFLAAWLVATHKNGISARQLWRQLGLGSYKTALLLLAYARLKAVKHDPKVVGSMAAHVVLPWIHRVFANAKRWALGVYHGLRAPHLQRYLDEYVFRFNRRRTPQAAFASLLGLAVRHDHATYHMLIRQT